MYSFKVENKEFNSGTHVMGIINSTNDSFFINSRVKEDFLNKAKEMIDAGAEIIDIGGQSTRPGAEMIPPDTELARVLPVIQGIKDAFPSIIVSCDTFYPEVAETVLNYGADMINCVSFTQPMAHVISRFNKSICVMHNRRNSNESDLFLDKLNGLKQIISVLDDSFVPLDHVMLDLGIGFNKTINEDKELLDNYDSLMNEFPNFAFLLGASRKSFLGGEVEDRLIPTLNTTRLAKKYGVAFCRVHDVKENMEVLNER